MIKVLILTTSVAFPNGMAPAQRVKLLARVLVEANFDVSILCTQVTEHEDKIKNSLAYGTFLGIPFEYTTGTTIRSNNFFLRRYIEIKGIIKAIYRIIEARKNFSKLVIYHYGNNLKNESSKWLFYLVANILHVPIILDLRERPWILENPLRKSLLNFSPLTGVSGVVAISKYLTIWTRNEAEKLQKDIKVITIPILVDNLESTSTIIKPTVKNVLFAGSAEYDSTIFFIIESMIEVWKVHPECKLIITGIDPFSDEVEKILNSLTNSDIRHLIEFTGYLPREELFKKYQQSYGLLIPLFNDIRSIARFPTKIGEYLSSGRPIVSNMVGEIPVYFCDKKNAYICEPGSSASFGRKIIELLDNEEEAEIIGKNGKKTSEAFFQYQVYSIKLNEFIKSFLTSAK
jgi:glycosyltransferase involved in cell wall biosynthesis